MNLGGYPQTSIRKLTELLFRLSHFVTVQIVSGLVEIGQVPADTLIQAHSRLHEQTNFALCVDLCV